MFNEESHLQSFLSQLAKYSKNIIVVNDGSTDRTSKILNTFDFCVINHPENLGKGAAMKTGVEDAIAKNAGSVIFMDADGQHRTKDIKQFNSNLNNGYDLVFGSRKYQNHPPVLNNFGKYIVTKLINIIYHTNRTDILCGFFAFKINIYPLIMWSSSRYEVETEIAIKAAKNRISFKEVFINSNYPIGKKGIGIKDVIATVINIPRWIIS